MTGKNTVTKMIMTWAVAFAMAFSVLPAAAVCAGEETVEPTGTASEMLTDGETNDSEEPESEAGPTDGNGDAVLPGEESEPENGLNVPGDYEAEPAEEETAEPLQQETSSEAATSVQETSAAEESTSAPETETDGVVEAMAASSAPVKTPVRKWKTPKGKKVLSLTVCRNPDGTVFDLMAQAKQKLYGYDTVQGAAAGKGFGYFSLYNRKVTRAKIVKVRLKDMKVIKVSPALNICHANDFTYNNKKNILVVANSDPKAKRLTVIDVNTLKIKYHKTLKVTRKVSGMSKKQRKKFKGVGAIAYNEKHNCYICRIRKSNDLLFLDANLKPYKRVRQNKKVSGMLYQGMDSYKDCIMVTQSFKGKKKYNLITVYNMKGKYLARFKMARGMPALEMEAVFHNGRQFYACFYSSYGAKADKEKLEIKRDNFVFKINNL